MSAAVEAHKKELEEITHLRNALPPFPWPAAILEKIRAEWTYHSNALEGNSLTLGDTVFFLREGLTVEGKPWKDFLEAKNHAEAIDYLMDVIRSERPFTEGLLKELNGLLLRGVESTEAQTSAGQSVRKRVHGGEYKKEPNHVLTLSGKIHYYVAPLQVPGEMERLFRNMASLLGDKNAHPLVVAGTFHWGLTRIHPFDDCNGRVSRLSMNLLLMKAHYPPAVLPMEERRQYLESLEASDNMDSAAPFLQFLLQIYSSQLKSWIKYFSA